MSDATGKPIPPGLYEEILTSRIERLLEEQLVDRALSEISDLDVAEAADRLGVSVETIHVRKSRGLSNLRRLINEKGNGPEGRDGTP